MSILDIVKTKLNNPKVPDMFCQLCIDETEVTIKNYCCISVLPEALKFTWANMAVDLIRYQWASANKDSEQPKNISAGDISSIKIGDTNIQIGEGSITNQYNKAIKSHQANLDSLVMNYKDQLNKFRRMVW